MLGIFLDTETNGLNPYKHRTLEIAYKIIDVSTKEIKEEYEAVVKIDPLDWKQSDRDSLKLNGFTWEQLVSEGKDPSIVAQEITRSFQTHKIQRGQAVFICQNPSFDRAFFSQLIAVEMQEKLLWPYHWLDLASMYWAEAIKKGHEMPWKTGISKDKIAAHFKLQAEKKPHRAMNGVEHLILCYEAVVGFTELREPE